MKSKTTKTKGFLEMGVEGEYFKFTESEEGNMIREVYDGNIRYSYIDMKFIEEEELIKNVVNTSPKIERTPYDIPESELVITNQSQQIKK